MHLTCAIAAVVETCPSDTGMGFLGFNPNVETCPSDKLVNLARKDTTSTDSCKCHHVPKIPESGANELVRRKAGSYLMAAKGLLKQVNKQMNKVDSLYSINLH